MSLRPLSLTARLATTLTATAILALGSSFAYAQNGGKIKSAQELGRGLSELHQAAESMARDADKAQEQATLELAASEKVLAETRKVLADAEKALAGAQARLKAAEENARIVSALRKTIREADEAAKRQLNPPKKVDSPADKPAPKADPKKTEPRKAESKKTEPKPAPKPAAKPQDKPDAKAAPAKPADKK